MEVDMNLNAFVVSLKDLGLSSEEIKSLITEKIQADKETKALEKQIQSAEAIKALEIAEATKALEIQSVKDTKIEIAKINASKSQVIFFLINKNK